MKQIDWSKIRHGVLLGIGIVLGIFTITIAYEIMMAFIYAFYTHFIK
jgi:xanthine/uracil/vitamin C permease (AzgA family)